MNNSCNTLFGQNGGYNLLRKEEEKCLQLINQDCNASSASPTEKNDLRLLTNFDFQSQLSSVKRIECPNLDQLVQDSAESSQRLTMWWWQSQILLDSCSTSILCVCGCDNLLQSQILLDSCSTSFFLCVCDCDNLLKSLTHLDSST